MLNLEKEELKMKTKFKQALVNLKSRLGIVTKRDILNEVATLRSELAAERVKRKVGRPRKTVKPEDVEETSDEPSENPTK